MTDFLNGINVTGDATVSGNVTGTWNGTEIAATKGGTGLTAVGSTGNVLTSNGTVWTSAAPLSGLGQPPTFIPAGETFTVQANKQVLIACPIIVDGTLTVDGRLVDVGGSTGTTSGFIFNGGKAGTVFTGGPSLNLGGAT